MRAPTKEETKAAYGIRYDRPGENYYSDNPYADKQPDPAVYGYPTGILGMRLFKNPEFFSNPAARRRWDSDRFYADQAYSSNPNTIKPYVVGVSCAICHVSFHPLNPPTNVSEPKWENISSTIGAQYLRIREVFGNTHRPGSYLYEVVDSQFPGTIDTSLVATDHINNANTMNAVFGLRWRATRALYNPMEKLSDESFGPPGARYPGLWDSNVRLGKYDYPPDFARFRDEIEGNPRRVPRVLVDGSDSVGTWIALARVYLNIGTHHQQWARTHNMILGYRDQAPFRLADLEANSVYWHATKIRVDSMTAYFLKATEPMLLEDAIVNNEDVEKFPATAAVKAHAKENANYEFSGRPTDPALEQGRAVFARGCIACHSSKQPDFDGLEVRDGDNTIVQARTLGLDDLWRLTRGDGQLPDDYRRWAELAVEQPEFWDENYLSTDQRIPVTITQTNSARAMATNAKQGHVWEDFASDTFQDLPSVGKIQYRDPFSGATNEFEAPSGGPGYYRVPSLISAWATAPFLHNNALGDFNNDPSVKGRLEAFDDAIRKLLTPRLRIEEGHDLAKLGEDARTAEELERGWRVDLASFDVEPHSDTRPPDSELPLWIHSLATILGSSAPLAANAAVVSRRLEDDGGRSHRTQFRIHRRQNPATSFHRNGLYDGELPGIGGAGVGRWLLAVQILHHAADHRTGVGLDVPMGNATGRWNRSGIAVGGGGPSVAIAQDHPRCRCDVSGAGGLVCVRTGPVRGGHRGRSKDRSLA